MTTEPRPACDGEWGIFDILIDRMDGHEFRWAQREARALCLQCPVRDACWAEHREELWLAAVRDSRPQPTIRPTCGTPAGAKAHYTARETTCDDCRKAEAKRTRDRKRNRAQAKCGTESGYHRHKRVTRTTPCQPCLDAHAAAQRAREAAKRDAAA